MTDGGQAPEQATWDMLAELIEVAPPTPDNDAKTSAFVAEWLAVVEDPTAEVSEGRPGRHVLRAFGLSTAGRLSEACEEILETAKTSPRLNLPRYALGLLDDERARGQLRDKQIASLLRAVCTSLRQAGLGEGPLLSTLAEVAALAYMTDPDSEHLCASAAEIGIGAGQALAVTKMCERFLKQNDAYLVRFYLSSAYLSVGQRLQGLREMERAAALTDVEVPLLNVGDFRLDGGDIVGARRAYEEALRRNPGSTWAQTSLAYCDHLCAVDGAKERFDGFVREGDRRAKILASTRPSARYFTSLEPPEGPLLRSLRGVMPTLTKPTSALSRLFRRKPGVIRVGLTNLGFPSAHLCYEAVVSARSEATVEVGVGSMPEPGPRKPKAAVAFELFNYDEAKPTPALGSPATGWVERIQPIAARPSSLTVWSGAAAGLSATDADVPSIVRLVAHASKHFDAHSDRPWVTMFQVQIAACLVIARAEGAWGDSNRRRALLSLLHGPADWSTLAAIVALTEVVRADPTCSADVAAELSLAHDRLTDRDHDHFCGPIRWAELVVTRP